MDTPSDVPIPEAADMPLPDLPPNVVSFKRPPATSTKATDQDDGETEIQSVDDLIQALASIKSTIESASVVIETIDGRNLFMFSPQTSMQMVFKAFAMQTEVATLITQGRHDDDD